MGFYQCDYLKNEGWGILSTSYVCGASGRDLQKSIVNNTCMTSSKYYECHYYKQASRLFHICTAVVENTMDKEQSTMYIQTFSRWRNNNFNNSQQLFYETEYLPIAPKIVDYINTLEDKQDIYSKLRVAFIEPIYESIKREDYDKAFEIFLKMFNECKQLYCKESDEK